LNETFGSALFNSNRNRVILDDINRTTPSDLATLAAEAHPSFRQDNNATFGLDLHFSQKNIPCCILPFRMENEPLHETRHYGGPIENGIVGTKQSGLIFKAKPDATYR
jgi:hypothetical protein